MSDLNSYQDFVYSTTSDQSAFFGDFSESAVALEEHVNVPLLLTASIGLSSECGEFSEIVKKLMFQGKPYSEDVRYHMKRELGDILWYLANAATALDYDLEDIMGENIEKLRKRYPEGFESGRSENREQGDI